MKVVGTIGERPPFAPAPPKPASGNIEPKPAPPAPVNMSEHPLVKRANELFGRRIGDGGQ